MSSYVWKDSGLLLCQKSESVSIAHIYIFTVLSCLCYLRCFNTFKRRSQWPRGLRRGSVAACLLELGVRIPPGAWIFVSCECCVLWGRGVCDGLITRPEEPYRVWCVIVCDLETSWMRRPWPSGGLLRQINKKKLLNMQHVSRTLNSESCLSLLSFYYNSSLVIWKVDWRHVLSLF